MLKHETHTGSNPVLTTKLNIMWRITCGTDRSGDGVLRIWLSDRFYLHFIYRKL